jgi:Predicted membrane protein (DUF2207) C-terminal domain
VNVRRRRVLGGVIAAGGALVLGAAAAAGVIGGDTQRTTRRWVRAEVATDGGAAITDSVDFAFGPFPNHHGIDLFVPGLARTTPVTAESPDAPDDLQLIPESHPSGQGLKIRVGDPLQTVSGHHRYRIDYLQPGLVQGTTLDWEALGTESAFPTELAEVHLLTPFELTDVVCTQGGEGSTAPCDSVRTVAPGHVVAVTRDLSDHEGLSVEGHVGSPVAVPAVVPRPPAGPPPEPGTGLAPPVATAIGAGLVGALVATIIVRRAGRERVVTGGAADVAYAMSGPGAPPPDPGGPAPAPVREIRVDASELANMATTEFAPPAGVAPAHGGIVLTEEVRPEHKVAWLVQAAIDGAVDLDDSDGVRLTRIGPGTHEQAQVLDMAFDGRSELELGSYDQDFGRAWTRLDTQLEDWRDASGLWDPRGDRRRWLALGLGILAAILFTAGVFGAALMAGRDGSSWLPAVAGAAALAAAGLAAAVSAWELRIRTAEGSGLWLRVESFRRFLAGSEAYHAEEAAKRGVLREYTAWALALGEIDRWSRAVAASSLTPTEAGVGYAYMAPLLLYSTTSTATAPSSSGSGGGFGGGFGGGSVGGGSGGGSVGSW